MALRTLIAGKSLYYNPQVLIYHNRWLNSRVYQKQELSYICGEIACYGYFALLGHTLGKTVVKENITDTISDVKRIARAFYHLHFNAFSLSFLLLCKTVVRLKGFMLAEVMFLLVQKHSLQNHIKVYLKSTGNKQNWLTKHKVKYEK